MATNDVRRTWANFTKEFRNEPFLSQYNLNRSFKAFITKVKNDMILQSE
jgi:hypothetical protein